MRIVHLMANPPSAKTSTVRCDGRPDVTLPRDRAPAHARSLAQTLADRHGEAVTLRHWPLRDTHVDEIIVPNGGVRNRDALR